MRNVFIAAATALALSACTQNAKPFAVSPALTGAANTIEVTAERGAPASASVDMPDMQMPPKVYALRRLALHAYAAQNVAFAMAGTWRVIVRSAAGARLAVYEIEVK